jgi:hypothetical protein
MRGGSSPGAIWRGNRRGSRRSRRRAWARSELVERRPHRFSPGQRARTPLTGVNSESEVADSAHPTCLFVRAKDRAVHGRCLSRSGLGLRRLRNVEDLPRHVIRASMATHEAGVVHGRASTGSPECGSSNHSVDIVREVAKRRSHVSSACIEDAVLNRRYELITERTACGPPVSGRSRCIESVSSRSRLDSSL